VAGYEAGAGARGPTVRKLAEALNVSIADLSGEHAYPKVVARPEVQEWLAAHGHTNRDQFRNYVENLNLDIDEAGWPRGLERAIYDLRQTRDGLIEELKTPATRNALFPPRMQGLATKEERVREALRPAKEALYLEPEIRHEYLTREVDLINYGRKLHASGVTSDHLTYARPDEHERRFDALLEEAYAQAGAA
jgi:hypothetical protein